MYICPGTPCLITRWQLGRKSTPISHPIKQSCFVTNEPSSNPLLAGEEKTSNY